MTLLSTTLHLVQSRAETLSLLVVLGCVLGEFLARGPFTHALTTLTSITRTLGHKLDREHRAIATRVYRGIIAVLMLVLPAIALAAAIGQPVAWLKLLTAILMVAWFGHCFSSISTLALYRRAHSSGLPLELPQMSYLFADGHAVIRYLIATRLEAFAVGVVGGCFWYGLGGVMALAIYLVLAGAHAVFQQRAAFGWAARSLFRLANALPAILARALIFLAALFTPHTRPLRGLAESTLLAAAAATLDIALGGPMPTGERPWVGPGTAKLTPVHLQRAMQLLAVAAVLLVLLLAHQQLYNLLIKFI